MIIELLLFIHDFLWATYLEQWLVYGLATYFLVLLSMHEETLRSYLLKITPALLLLAIQGTFLHDRFGLMLIFLIPLIPAAFMLNKIIMHPMLLCVPFISYFFICQDIIIKNYIFSQNFMVSVTIKKILINSLVGYLVLWGTRGNRLFQRK